MLLSPQAPSNRLAVLLVGGSSMVEVVTARKSCWRCVAVASRSPLGGCLGQLLLTVLSSYTADLSSCREDARLVDFVR